MCHCFLQVSTSTTTTSEPRLWRRKSSSPCQTARLLSASWSTFTASTDTCSPSLTRRPAMCMANTPERHATTSCDAPSSVSDLSIRHYCKAYTYWVIDISGSNWCDISLDNHWDHEFLPILHTIYVYHWIAAVFGHKPIRLASQSDPVAKGSHYMSKNDITSGSELMKQW